MGTAVFIFACRRCTALLCVAENALTKLALPSPLHYAKADRASDHGRICSIGLTGFGLVVFVRYAALARGASTAAGAV
jgi:hypothetical protein